MQSAQKRPRTKLSGLNDPRIVPYVMILPFVIYLLGVYLYPTISTIIMSFQRIDGPNTAEFIGLSNYNKLLYTTLGKCLCLGNDAIHLTASEFTANGGNSTI